MPDGLSTTKIVLSVSGLAFDLIGAFLLSIPMVWSSKDAATLIRKAIRCLPFGVYMPYKPVGYRVFYLVLLLITVMMLFGAYYISSMDLLIFFGTHFPMNNKLALILAIGGGYGVFVLLCLVLSDGLSFLGDGNHDKRIGGFGLILLSTGFILQFIVNMQLVQ